ncbi:hypothetical protein PIB30_035827 [Stylosanthes scabra]|uniref:2-oxo-4-hydroxy-4-carboxy-5-ureidoimidazoline decarboxylase n=1 Tax=Stylosanthes scabra TaxID=79078 RepID=A0ABU6YAG4_9FABA|nr:hypothetical protein [Stylosanthes scabra]
MVSASPFKSLDHAIMVARDIFLNQLDVSCWVEALSSRDCFDLYLADANETTVQELHEWGPKYEKKFGYRFVTSPYDKSSREILTELKMRFKINWIVELDIASKEEMNIVETKIAGFYVPCYQNTGSAEDNLGGAITDRQGNLGENTSFGTDVRRPFEANHYQEKEGDAVERQHVIDESSVAHRNFDI